MTLTALVKTFEGLLVARLFLGAAEAGVCNRSEPLRDLC